MADGIRFRDGRVIDFQSTDWKIEVDEGSGDVHFTNQNNGNDFVFRADGYIAPEASFEFATALLFENTQWQINDDDATDELVFEHTGTGNQFRLDNAGNFSLPTNYEVAQDVLFDGALKWANSDWSAYDSGTDMVFEHGPSGNQFVFTDTGELDVPESFTFSEEDITFNSVGAQSYVRLPTYSDLNNIPAGDLYTRSIYHADGTGPQSEGLYRWRESDDTFIPVGWPEDELGSIALSYDTITGFGVSAVDGNSGGA